MTNIILIGMPGAGKTTVGKPLADNLGYNFRDSDDDILEKTNCDVSDWLKGLGDEKFLNFESQKIQQYYTDMTNTVLSTGGSVVLVSESVDFLKKRGKCILLDTPIESILARQSTMKTDRIVGMNGKNPRFINLQELFEFRQYIYRQAADITIQTFGKEVDTIIDEIKKTTY